MKKILDYLYIFSKLSTSFILLLGILILGYFFYISFNNQEKQDNDKAEYINKLNENSKQLLMLSTKIQITESSLEEIAEVLKINNNESNTKEISLLNKKIAELTTEIEDLFVSFQETQTSIVNNKNSEVGDSSSDTIINKNKSELSKLIILKFENSLDFSEELSVLQKLNDERNKHVFEKISLVNVQNYRGNVFLKNLFAKETDIFLKKNTNSGSNNIIKNSLMKFVIIEPSNKNIIKNSEIKYLDEINSLIDQKDYKISYNKMINIKNYQIFFSDTLIQLKIAIEFNELIQKVS